MTNEEKILDILALMQSEMQGMKGEIQGVKSEMQGMKGEMQGMKNDMQGMKNDMQGMKGDMQGMKGEIQGIKHDMQSMEGRLNQKIEDTRTDIMTYIESAVNPKLEILAEGHRAILDSMVPLNRVEELEEDVKLLKMAFRQMSTELQALKKAQ